MVTTSNAKTAATIREEYDVHGIPRNKLQSGPEGSTSRQSDLDGSVGNAPAVIVRYKYDPATRRTESTTTKEETALSRSSAQWSKADIAMVTTQPDGSFTETLKNPVGL